MTINEYKAAIKQMVDATDDEALLKHWKNHLEPEFEKYRKGQSQSTKKDNDKDDGYVVLESGLGIDE